MGEPVSNLANPNVRVRIDTAKTLTENVVKKTNGILIDIGDRSAWAGDVIEVPGQSAPRMQGSRCDATLTKAATGAIATMANTGDRKVIRRLAFPIKAGMPKGFFVSKPPTELADQNYLPILTDTLKSKNYIEEAMARIKYQYIKKLTASVSVSGQKTKAKELSFTFPFPLSEGGVYEYEKR